jgi:hypothetical protein
VNFEKSIVLEVSGMENISAQQALEDAKGITFEDVWAAMLRTDARIEESRKQTDARIEESRKQTDARIEESHKKVENLISGLSKRFGGLGNSLGELTEALFSPELWKKFSQLGYEFTGQARNFIFTEGKRVVAEVDVFLQNGDYVMPVEVKTKLTIDCINKHFERIDVIRRYMDNHQDKRILIGAVAGGIIEEEEINYAQDNGLFVITSSGESVTIADTISGFTLRKWLPAG